MLFGIDRYSGCFVHYVGYGKSDIYAIAIVIRAVSALGLKQFLKVLCTCTPTKHNRSQAQRASQASFIQ